MATLLTPLNIIVGVIFAPLLIFVLIKISTSLSGGVKKAMKYPLLPLTFMGEIVSKPWKLVRWGLMLGAGYGIYLIIINNLPTPEEKMFSELTKNLAEVELRPEKDKLSALNTKVKSGEGLTLEEKRTAMEATKKIGKVRKNYSEGKLVAPAPIIEKPVPTTKMAWVLRLDGSFNRQSSDAVEIDEKSIFRITETEIMFSYYKRGEKHDVWLIREKSGKFYHGVLSLSDKTKQDLYLLENGEAFSGYIQQINGNGKSKKALLRKEEVMIK